MSIFNDRGQAVAPDKLAEAGLCPECGARLDVVDHDTHIAGHWPKERSPEASRRIELIKSYGRTEAGAKAQAELKRIADEEAAAARRAATPVN
jgi:hypothetical protein